MIDYFFIRAKLTSSDWFLQKEDIRARYGLGPKIVIVIVS